ncbi:MAG: hypothetical protein JWN97_1349 [Nocardioides sp.]|nr:hypothetical protein [Nocardioides sp.]
MASSPGDPWVGVTAGVRPRAPVALRGEWGRA